MSLTIRMKHADDRADVVVVSLDGRLDTATAPDLERELDPVLEGSTREVIFDLEKLTFVSSAGLRIFGKVRKHLRARDGGTSFVHMQPQIAEVFEIVKALPGMSVFTSVAELDRYLAARQRMHGQDQ
ncbi:MAG TPA: STAS domain-containing protein [Longimicrobiales bacterium]|nr:STAS domain-containing protein [Longimicrobiales bacterium]